MNSLGYVFLSAAFFVVGVVLVLVVQSVLAVASSKWDDRSRDELSSWIIAAAYGAFLTAILVPFGLSPWIASPRSPFLRGGGCRRAHRSRCSSRCTLF